MFSQRRVALLFFAAAAAARGTPPAAAAGDADADVNEAGDAALSFGGGAGRPSLLRTLAAEPSSPETPRAARTSMLHLQTREQEASAVRLSPGHGAAASALANRSVNSALSASGTMLALDKVAASESSGSREAEAAAQQSEGASTVRARAAAKARAKSSEESAWMWFGLLFVAAFYLIIWRAFNLASDDKIRMLPPRPVAGPQDPSQPAPAPSPLAASSPLPMISSRLVSVTRDFPVAIPLDPLEQSPVWSISVTGCTGVPLLNAVRRIRDPNDVSLGDIGILDSSPSCTYLCGVTSELQVFDGQNRLFGTLEEHDANSQFGARFVLREVAGSMTRMCFDYAHDTGDIAVLALPKGKRVAVLTRKVGTFGSRRGKFLELMIHPGADAVLIVACTLCILSFVAPTEKQPQRTGYLGPMAGVNPALADCELPPASSDALHPRFSQLCTRSVVPAEVWDAGE